VERICIRSRTKWQCLPTLQEWEETCDQGPMTSFFTLLDDRVPNIPHPGLISKFVLAQEEIFYNYGLGTRNPQASDYNNTSPIKQLEMPVED
jgi:hypothetical protein